MVDRLAEDLLGRHVGGGANDHSRTGQPAVAGKLGDAEVEDLDLAVPGDHQVGRFDVAMDDALGVGAGKPRRDLDRIVDGLFNLQTAAPDFLLEGFAFVAGHGDEEFPLAIPGLADFVDRTDIRMIEGRRGPGLVQKALAVVLAVEMGGKELEGGEPAEPEVTGLVDDTHPATPELLEDFVLGNGPPNPRWAAVCHRARDLSMRFRSSFGYASLT